VTVRGATGKNFTEKRLLAGSSIKLHHQSYSMKIILALIVCLFETHLFQLFFTQQLKNMIIRKKATPLMLFYGKTCS
jgi:hypothetical protein